MNKKLVSVALIVVLLAGGGYYLSTKKGPSPLTEKKLLSEATQFAKAIESGKPTTCTMTKGTDTMEYLIKGKMMRADIKTTVNDKLIVSHMINDTKYFYSWTDGTAQGSKIAIPTEDESNSDVDKDKVDTRNNPSSPKFNSEADYESYKNEGYTINCKPSTEGDSAFVPPTDIKFIDPSEIMKAIPSPGAEGKYDMSKLQELQKQYGGTTPANY